MNKGLEQNRQQKQFQNLFIARNHLSGNFKSVWVQERGSDRGTIDTIFTARQLQQKCKEQNEDLYMTFVDLTNAFHTVSRGGLCKIMAKFGCPPRYIAMVRKFHDDMQARVQNDGEYSEPFPVNDGVKQGCVMAPTLFSMMFSAMLTDASQDVDAGIPIRQDTEPKKAVSQVQGADRCG